MGKKGQKVRRPTEEEALARIMRQVAAGLWKPHSNPDYGGSIIAVIEGETWELWLVHSRRDDTIPELESLHKVLGLRIGFLEFLETGGYIWRAIPLKTRKDRTR